MKIIPTLSIKNLSTSKTSFTKDCDNNLCATGGSKKNEKNQRKFFMPLYKEIIVEDLDQLAVVISDLADNTDDLLDINNDDIIDDRQPLETIVVYFDRSYSMNDKCFNNVNDVKMSGLEVVKEYWEAFLNRSKAYDYPNHIGLILFDTNIKISCNI